uniref:Uncharacterized protein n=1 Tax=Rhizophora mucronata TaxID=61149 RepID=A0A2P2N7C6_RHIMU
MSLGMLETSIRLNSITLCLLRIAYWMGHTL